jgi:hypothetical protein
LQAPEIQELVSVSAAVKRALFIPSLYRRRQIERGLLEILFPPQTGLDIVVARKLKARRQQVSASGPAEICKSCHAVRITQMNKHVPAQDHVAGRKQIRDNVGSVEGQAVCPALHVVLPTVAKRRFADNVNAMNVLQSRPDPADPVGFAAACINQGRCSCEYQRHVQYPSHVLGAFPLGPAPGPCLFTVPFVGTVYFREPAVAGTFFHPVTYQLHWLAESELAGKDCHHTGKDAVVIRYKPDRVRWLQQADRWTE